MRLQKTNWRRTTTVVAASTAAMLALAACGSSGSGSGGDGSGDGGPITAAVAYETTDYNPSATSSALAMGANWHVVEGLYNLDMTDYSVQDGLANGDPEEVSETEFEVTLRDGAKFSDGEDVTADDVVESFERAQADGNIYVPMLSFIDSVSAKDDDTVTIETNKPFTLLKERLAIVKVIPEDSSEKDMTSQPVGTGPWKYDSISETELTFSPNEHYNGEFEAQAESMEWDVIKDDTARTTALQDGTVNIMENVTADKIEMLENSGMDIAKEQGFNLPFVLFNTDKAPFDDPAVRQALLYAIDTDKMIDNAMDGEAAAATSFLPENHENYNEASNVFDHNPDKAKELLDEADVDGLSLTLLTTDHSWIEALAPQVKNDLEEIGIDTTIKGEASESLYANHLDVDDPEFDVALAPGDPSVFGNDPDLLMQWWYGDNVWTDKRTQWQHSDPDAFEELHAILDDAVELEGDEQQEKWNEAQDLLSDEVPLYPLFHRSMITAHNPEAVDNMTPISTTGLWLLNATSK